jgi:hypothetical protein
MEGVGRGIVAVGGRDVWGIGVMTSERVDAGGSPSESTGIPLRGDRCPGTDSLKTTSLEK